MLSGRYRQRFVAATVLLILVGTLAVSAIVAILIVRSSRVRAQQRLTEVPGPALRSTAATSLGLASLDEGQVRGTGTLILTEGEVAFAQWRPDRLVRIPRPAIIEVDTTRSHLGKTMTSDLLRIRWTAAEGEDTVAFFVRDLDPWLTDLGGKRGDDGGS
jgi:hypothetical protein